MALEWPTPDDLDLEVYRKQGGELVQVATSGNAPGEKERAELADPVAGEYVLRVVNFASASPSYTLTRVVLRRAHPHHRDAGGYTFTCEKHGRVLQRERVFVDRGDRVRLDLTECRRKA